MKRLLVVLLLFGCGPAPRAPFTPCPIQERQCRVDTLLALEGERGQVWDPWAQPPFVSVISVEDLQRRLDLLRLLTLGPDAWGPWARPLGDLGLLSPQLTISESDRRWAAENTTAFYWSRDKEVTIIDRGRVLNDLDAVAILAHEYTHAAQDREFGLEFLEAWPTTDSELVRMTLVEGEAELYERLARLRMEGVDPSTFDFRLYFGGWLRSVRNETAAADSPHTHVRLDMPYPAGGLLMARAWQRGGSAAVDRVLLERPQTFATILRTIEDRPEPGPIRPLCKARMIPAEQYFLLAVDRLGAALLYAYLARAFNDDEGAWEASLTWQGDQLWSLKDRTSNLDVTFWNVHAPGLRNTPLGMRIAAGSGPPRLVGDDLIFWTSATDEAALTLHQATSCGH